MVANEIHLLQAESGSWLVTEGRWHPPKRYFRLRPHAMAFACAVAGARGLEIVVHGPDGSQTRQIRPSQRDCATAAASAEDDNDVLTELLDQERDASATKKEEDPGDVGAERRWLE
jgi:hypothetical protein